MENEANLGAADVIAADKPQTKIGLGDMVDYHHGDGIVRAAIVVGFSETKNAMNINVAASNARDPVRGYFDDVELKPQDLASPERSYSLRAR